MASKKTLWLRRLSCGHIRPTSIAYICNDYTKPKISECAYCRECCQEESILGVEKATKKEMKELEDEIGKIKNSHKK